MKSLTGGVTCLIVAGVAWFAPIIPWSVFGSIGGWTYPGYTTLGYLNQFCGGIGGGGNACLAVSWGTIATAVVGGLGALAVIRSLIPGSPSKR